MALEKNPSDKLVKTCQAQILKDLEFCLHDNFQ